VRQHLGVTSVDFGFDGYPGTYHSIYGTAHHRTPSPTSPLMTPQTRSTGWRPSWIRTSPYALRDARSCTRPLHASSAP
jgi:hypothetical protein